MDTDNLEIDYQDIDRQIVQASTHPNAMHWHGYVPTWADRDHFTSDVSKVTCESCLATLGALKALGLDTE